MLVGSAANGGFERHGTGLVRPSYSTVVVHSIVCSSSGAVHRITSSPSWAGKDLVHELRDCTCDEMLQAIPLAGLVGISPESSWLKTGSQRVVFLYEGYALLFSLHFMSFPSQLLSPPESSMIAFSNFPTLLGSD